MKYFKKLILLLIILSLSYDEEQQYIPIEKYGKKNNFIESNIMFALDIRDIKESIYLKYSSLVKINQKLIQYYWS